MKPLTLVFTHPVKCKALLKKACSNFLKTITVNNTDGEHIEIPLNNLDDGKYEVTLEWENEGKYYSYNKRFEIRENNLIYS